MAISHIAQHLKELRDANQYTQSYVSSHLNIGRATYSNYETGKRIPSPELLIKVADFYQISLDSLIRPGSLDSSAASSEKTTALLSSEEAQLLALYRSLPKPAKKEVLCFTRFKKSYHC